MKINKRLLAPLLLLISLITFSAIPNNAYAAGSLSISGQAGSASVQTGVNNTYVVRVTPSGANVGSFSFTATFTNATFVTYVPTSGNSLDTNSLVSGSTGSTSIEVTAATMSLTGLSGTITVGTITVASGGSAGTSTVQLNLTSAYDGSAGIEPMTVNNSSASYQITSPAPPPSQPSQPTQPSTPSTPSSTSQTTNTTGSSSTQNSSTTTNTATSAAETPAVSTPIVESQVILPNEEGQPELMTESEANDKVINSDPDRIEVTVEEEKPNTLLFILGGVGLLAIITTIVTVVVVKMKRSHGSGTLLPGPIPTPTAPPVQEDIVAASIAKSKEMVNPEVHGVKVQQEPTVIYPTKKPE